MYMCKHVHSDIITCVTQFRDLTWSSILIKNINKNPHKLCWFGLFSSTITNTAVINCCSYNFVGISQIFTVNLELLVRKQKKSKLKRHRQVIPSDFQKRKTGNYWCLCSERKVGSVVLTSGERRCVGDRLSSSLGGGTSEISCCRSSLYIILLILSTVILM